MPLPSGLKSNLPAKAEGVRVCRQLHLPLYDIISIQGVSGIDADMTFCLLFLPVPSFPPDCASQSLSTSRSFRRSYRKRQR